MLVGMIALPTTGRSDPWRGFSRSFKPPEVRDLHRIFTRVCERGSCVPGYLGRMVAFGVLLVI
jgi:hypothetical protein